MVKRAQALSLYARLSKTIISTNKQKISNSTHYSDSSNCGLKYCILFPAFAKTYQVYF